MTADLKETLNRAAWIRNADTILRTVKAAAWQRDVPADCRCPHTWNGDQWTRSDGATCNRHPA